MQVGNLTIVLPIDDPCAYEPSWRHSLGQVLSEHRPKIPSLYKNFTNDKYVTKYIAYLRAEKAGKELTDDQQMIRLARSWYDNPSPAAVRFRLEPLLLTGATMETIMLDISGGMVPKEVFVYYEKLFFNIRDEEGRLSKSCQLRSSFAMPNGDELEDSTPQEAWKAIAALMGYDVLMHVWMWRDAHGLSTRGPEFLLDETWRAAQSRLFMSVFQNKVGHKSLSDILAAYTSQVKLIRDGKGLSDDGSDTTKALMAVLYQTSPHMISVAQDVDAMNAETAAIQSRIESQLAIEKHKIEDKGKQASDAVIDVQIADAIKSR